MRIEERIGIEDMDQPKKKKMKGITKLIIALIIILVLLLAGIVALIMYRLENPTQIVSYVDGKVVKGLDTILDIQKDEYGQTKIYIPIREFAEYLNAANPKFNYRTFKGEYTPKTEEDTKCHVIREGYEVAIFTKDSKSIYKLNLQTKSQDYEECIIDSNVYESNDKLYASEDGIEQGYNVQFVYDEKTKTIQIYTLDYFVQTFVARLKKQNIGNYGEMKIEEKDYNNCKTIFDDLLIVQNSNKKFGVLSPDFTTFILEPQYDDIDFIPDSKTFCVKSNGKVGIFSEDGKRKIDMIYDDITLMDKKTNLYMVKANNQYGVVDENGEIIIYPEYTKVGTNVSSFAYNEVKNGYILLNKLIPIQQGDKWGFFNIQGEKITDAKYSAIGCQKVRSGNNIYPLLQLPEKQVIVVCDENKKYSFVDVNGKDDIIPFVFDEMYIKTNEGIPSYWMTSNGTERDILEYLK